MSLVALLLRADGFDHYRCDRNISLGINLASMGKVLKCCNNDDILTLKSDDQADTMTFMFENQASDRISDFELKLMDIDSEHLGIPGTPATPADRRSPRRPLPLRAGPYVCSSLAHRPWPQPPTAHLLTPTTAATAQTPTTRALSRCRRLSSSASARYVSCPTPKTPLASSSPLLSAPAAPMASLRPPLRHHVSAPRPSPRSPCLPPSLGPQDLSILGDTVTIAVGKDGVKFSVSGELGSGNMTIRSNTSVDTKEEDQVEVNFDEPVALNFALRYLNFFTKATPLSGTVVLSLSKDVPLVVEYRLEELGHIRYYLAPKIEDEA